MNGRRGLFVFPIPSDEILEIESSFDYIIRTSRCGLCGAVCARTPWDTTQLKFPSPAKRSLADVASEKKPV